MVEKKLTPKAERNEIDQIFGYLQLQTQDRRNQFINLGSVGETGDSSPKPMFVTRLSQNSNFTPEI